MFVSFDRKFVAMLYRKSLLKAKCNLKILGRKFFQLQLYVTASFDNILALCYLVSAINLSVT